MSQTIVAIDLETTGLDSQRDTIIEIGAVKFKGERLEDEYTTLVNPGRPIPYAITQLTGINDAMVANAPRLSQVLPEIEDFTGEATVLGHNIKFDLSFLQAKKVLRYNDVADTYNLAAALLPSAARYNLGALAKELNLLLPATHRALDDARVTAAVYQTLFKKALALPLELLAEITNYSQEVDWNVGHFFEDALRARSKETVSARKARPDGTLGPLFGNGTPPARPLQPVEEIGPLDADDIASVLQPGGAFAKHFPAYEYRSEQVAMLKAVARAFSEGRHLMTEAGTGTGKCVTADTLITFADGRRKRIGEICQNLEPPTSPILCMAPSGKLTYQKIRSTHSNGTRPVWRLRTALGRSITATANHPFLTWDGWRQLTDLRVGVRIATLRHLPAGAKHIPGHEAFVVGAMLGDGCCIHLDSLKFTNYDPGVVEHFAQAVAKLGNVRLTTTKSKGDYGFRRLSLMGHERSGLSRLLERHGIAGLKSQHKQIPDEFFEADTESISHLLAGLWVTDGCIERRDGTISISSASHRLLLDIQHLLMRLQIIGRLRHKRVRLFEKLFDSWHLTVSDFESKQQFYQHIGPYLVGEKKIRLTEWWDTHKHSRFNPNDDLIPAEGWRVVDRERALAGRSWYAIRQTCIVASDRTRGISRQKMMAIGEFLGSARLVDWAQSDVYWDRIVAIEPAGQAPTFDLTMDGHPNFIANDMVVHNSFAYLIPAVQWARQNGLRVVVSTNTINLQEQLIKKDIPDLQATLGLDFSAALLKGRSHYLCPRRMENMRKHRPRTADELRVLAKVLVWLEEKESRPNAELSLGPIDHGAWKRLSAEDEHCTLDTCRERMQGVCPFYRARKAAEAAHVVIVNHALLLADIATENRVLPEYGYLVLDEAHHLEAATTDGLSFEWIQSDFERRIKDLGGPNSGLLGEVLSAAREKLSPEKFVGLEVEIGQVYERATDSLAMARSFFESVSAFMEERRDGKPISDYGQTVRIIPATRTHPLWDQIKIQWDQLKPTMNTLADLLLKIGQRLDKWSKQKELEFEEAEDLASSVNLSSRFFIALLINGDGLVVKPEPNAIYWAEAGSRDGRISLNAAPLHVGALVEKHLWNTKDAVVMTSATLTAGGSFRYLKSRLNAQAVDELTVGSPFNYEASSLLYLATDMPEPVARFDYQKAIEKTFIDLFKATRGRALALFTSYAQLKQTAQAIRGPLQRAGVDVYDQSDGTARSTLLENFKTSEGGVLLGTKSFWEGVDVPGEALSVLVITRLPFDVPDDPIVAARAETFERPFDEYSVPEAVLKFRQGFGRLIRTKSDRGVVVVLDRRILTKAYGKVFLDSLPRCTVRRAPLAQLPKDAAKWIDG